MRSPPLSKAIFQTAQGVQGQSQLWVLPRSELCLCQGHDGKGCEQAVVLPVCNLQEHIPISQGILIPLPKSLWSVNNKVFHSVLGILISSLTPAWGNKFHELTTHRVKSDFLLLFLNIILSRFKQSPLVVVQDWVNEFMTTNHNIHDQIDILPS